MAIGVYDRQKTKFNPGMFQKGHKFLPGGEKGWFKKGHSIIETAFKKGNIPWIKGKKHSQESRLKMSKSHIDLQIIGERHHNWKGENAGYYPKHTWVRWWKGDPEICEFCGVKAEEIGTIKMHWANIDHKYRRNLDDYISLCVNCHKKYGYELQRQN